MSRRADYSSIAGTYDKARELPADALEQWVSLIRERGHVEADFLCLDLGCGTGRFAIPLYEATGACVVGADLSAEMLKKAREKPGTDRLLWVRCDAQWLPFGDCRFDCVFMSLVLHHVDDMGQVLAECRRVLGPDGVCLIRTTAHEQMESMPVYRFFPGAWEIDRNRLPPIGVIKDGLRSVGFRRVSHEPVTQGLVTSADAYIRKMRSRNISALTLLTDEEFAEGMSALETYVEKVGPEAFLAEVRTEDLTLITAEM